MDIAPLPHTGIAASPTPDNSLVAPWLDNALTETRRLRHDGWTPERKRGFLERLAETGTIKDACAAVGMSAQTAYRLRWRDPVFGAGWDAALTLARGRLADELLSRALNGVVDQIHRDGAIVAERHRYDNRLSMAMLTRLDTRLDRQRKAGAVHLRVVRQWDAFIEAIGHDPESAEAAACGDGGETAPHLNLRNLCGLADPANAPAQTSEDSHMIWEEENDEWWTDYPPPPGFDGEERGAYGDHDYARTLSPAERAVNDADVAAENAEKQADAARLRDHYFGFAPDGAAD